MRDELDAIRREAEELDIQIKLMDEYREAVADKLRRHQEEIKQARADYLKTKQLMKQIEANQRRIDDAFTGGVQRKSLGGLLDDAVDGMDAALDAILALGNGLHNPSRHNRFLHDEIVPDEFE